MAEHKKTVTITQYVKELIYDVQNKTYLAGRTKESEGSKDYKSASHMQASGDEEDDYRIKRSINNAVSQLKNHLGEYLSVAKLTSDNKIATEIDTDSVITFSFSMPSNYNEAATESLGNSIHEYLVSSAVAEWYMITNKEDVEGYALLAEGSLKNVTRALYSRSRPARPTYV